jgi:hypothetical protein
MPAVRPLTVSGWYRPNVALTVRTDDDDAAVCPIRDAATGATHVAQSCQQADA